MYRTNPCVRCNYRNDKLYKSDFPCSQNMLLLILLIRISKSTSSFTDALHMPVLDCSLLVVSQNFKSVGTHPVFSKRDHLLVKPERLMENSGILKYTGQDFIELFSLTRN